MDEVKSMVIEIEAIKHQMEQNQSKIKEKDDEKAQIEALLEDFRANFDRLTMESKQKDATVESLKEQVWICAFSMNLQNPSLDCIVGV